MVGLAVWIGHASIKGYGLGMVAGAIVVGAAVQVAKRTTMTEPQVVSRMFATG